jgi:hypothetical protein
VTVAVHPGVINLNSKGKWVTVVIEPQPPATVGDIDVSSIRLNGSVAPDPAAPVAVGDDDGDGIPGPVGQVQPLRSRRAVRAR